MPTEPTTTADRGGAGGGVRWASAADVAELVRLRRVMFESMGIEVRAADDERSAAAFRDGLPNGELFAAVVDGADHLAACGVGMSARRLPTPRNPGGRWGYIQSMVTDERSRRRGHARAVLGALMARFAAEGVTHVDLHATPDGEPLYRSFGFGEGHTPELRWRTPRPH